MCIFCKGKLEQTITDYVENAGGHVVLIRDVPCEKCKQCGEVFFDNATVCAIEDILAQMQSFKGEISLSVLDYTKVVA